MATVEQTTCSCGWVALAYRISTVAGLVTVVDCQECDRTTCRRCKAKVANRYARECPECHARLPMVQPQRGGW